MSALKAYTTRRIQRRAEPTRVHCKGGYQMSGAGTADRGNGLGMRGISFFPGVGVGMDPASRDPALVTRTDRPGGV